MGRRKKIKPTMNSSSMQHPFQCECGFELIIHTDSPFDFPGKCPKCKKKAWKGAERETTGEAIQEEEGTLSEESA